MESRNRNVWIIVAAALVALCCCALVAATAVAGWFLVWPVRQAVSVSVDGVSRVETFEAGPAPTLKVDNFAGNVIVLAGRPGEIRVVATKRVQQERDLARIEVEMSQRDGGLAIETRKQPGVDNASVWLEITAPAGTRLDASTGAGSMEVRGLGGAVGVHTGAGSVEIRGLGGDLRASTGAGSMGLHDVVGDIEAHSGSGSMTVRDSRGRVRLDTGSGSIDYQGAPEGDCRFETGAGSITLRLPAELNMRVDLETGSGTVEVAYDVEGQVSKRKVTGVIGDGDEGSIYADTGTGGIDLIQR